MFGQQQQKPLFGTSGFGAPASTQASAFGGFGQQTTQAGGLFGAAKPAFGQPAATTTTTGFGAFGQPAAGTGGLFGSKPFGAAAPLQQQATGGGMFGSAVAPAPAFGAAAPGTGTFGGFGAATAQPSIGLFGQQQAQPKPAFGGFGAAAAPIVSAAPAFGGFGAIFILPFLQCSGAL